MQSEIILGGIEINAIIANNDVKPIAIELIIKSVAIIPITIDAAVASAKLTV